ncbi:hypothetical protein [Sulfurimonas sp.]|uniref:hypothetical protein n=1 Tax=Sulfurimonas sp. TaxID=2022749 RepID=UPI002B480DBF|nr:hypothetical protein [Sulfurimonas sp.]
MALSQIGQNGVEEFAETIFYGIAYEEARGKLSEFTNSVDNKLLQEALAGAGGIIVSGIMFQLMRTQEGFIDSVFAKSKLLILGLLGSGHLSKFKNKTLGKLKGVKLFKKLKLFGGSQSDRIATANLVSQQTSQHFQADSGTSDDLLRLNTTTAVKASMVEKEKLNHSVAKSMTQNFNETLMLKMATKTFNSKDKTMLKKILGRDSSAKLDIEDMNKVADFMFTKDESGNMTGLSEQLFSIINGLGYLHNKV